MKNYFYLVLAVVLTSCNTSKSGLTIPPNEVFILGETQETSFTATIKNQSDHEVQLEIIKTANKSRVSGFGLSAGGTEEVYVGEGETALIKNDNDSEAFLDVVFNRSEVQGMRYEPLTLVESKSLKKDSLIRDLTLLEQALTELHPGLYRYNTPEDIKEAFTSFKNELPSKVPEAQFITDLAQLVSQIKCGHTYINPWNMNEEVRNRLYGNKQFFPLGFTIINGRFYATENASNQSSIKRGAEIFSINDIPIDKIYTDLKSVAKSDGNNFNPFDNYLSLKKYEESYWNAFDIYFPLFYPLSNDSYKINYRNPEESSMSTSVVEALTKKQRAEKMKENYGQEVLDTRKWSLEIDGELAIMRLGTFAIWKWEDFNHKEWFKKSFEKLEKAGIKNLAIDIRGNGGGLSEPKDEIISYLIDKELKCEDQGQVLIRTTKINPDLLPYIDTWAQPLINGLPEEYYAKIDDTYYQLLEPSECKDITPKANSFKGNVFILGDNSNVSATFTLLDQAQRNDFATYVGQPSGGNKQGINGGEYAFFTMPYSNIEVDIPLKYFSPIQSRRDEGLSPDYTVDVTQNDIINDTDPYLKFVKSKI